MPITFQNITITGGLQIVSAGAAGDPYWANVSLLMNTTSTNNQTNNTFLDSSTNNFAVTRVGSTTQGSFTPFALAPSTSYSTATNGGSAYFDGSGDFLTIANNSALNILSGDFTIETWFYPTSSSNTRVLIAQWQQTAGLAGYLLWQNGTTMQFAFGPVDAITPILSSSTAITINTWNHIAIVRSGSSFRMWLNGTSVATSTSAATLAAINVPTSLGQYYNASGTLGANGATDLVGYLSSTRIVKGTAVYNAANSTITVPTTPLTAISGTSLLLNFTNAGMYDAAAKNNMTSVGDAKVSTAQAKFAPTSVVFDGNSDALTILNNENFNLGSSDFTIEFWMYMTSFSDGKAILSKGWPTLNAPFLIYQDTVNNIVAFYSSSNGSSWDIADRQTIISAPQINQWYHVAISRSGNTFRLFSNGQLTTTFTNSSSLFNTTQQITIGSGSTTNANNFAGYIQDFRLTKGVARYTATFTPPTAAFPTSA